MLASPLSLLPDQTQQGGIGGEQDPPILEELTGTGQQRRRLIQSARFLEDEACQGFGLVGVEDGQLQIAANARLVIRDRMLPGRVPVDLGRVEVQLQGDEAQELVADLQGVLSREAAEESDEADLIGEPEAIMVATAPADFGQVGLGQGRFADHLCPREGE